MTLLTQIIKREWMHKAFCPFHSSMKVLSPAVDLIPRSHYFFMTCNVDYYVDYLLLVIRQMCLFCLHHCKISWFCQLSHSTCWCQKHKCLIVHIMGYTTFVSLWFSQKTVFVDIVPLWCKPSKQSSQWDTQQIQYTIYRKIGLIKDKTSV